MPVTQQELAALAHVSTATVSRVLSGKDDRRVGPKLRATILSLAEKHGYRMNPAAQALSKGRTYRIALCSHGPLVHSLVHRSMQMYERLSEFADAIQAANYAMEICQVDADRPLTKVSLELSRMAVDGFILLGWKTKPAEKLLFSLREKHIPSIASGTTFTDDTFSWTDVDRVDAYEQATRYLIEEGHREIVFLGSGSGPISTKKFRGFLNVMKRDMGIDARKRVFKAPSSFVPDMSRLTRQALQAFPKTTAFLLPGANYHPGPIYELQERGVEIGSDFRLIGFGETALADSSIPRLTHYGLRMRDQVQFSLKELFSAIEDPEGYVPKSKMFKSQLILRDT